MGCVWAVLVLSAVTETETGTETAKEGEAEAEGKTWARTTSGRRSSRDVPRRGHV